MTTCGTLMCGEPLVEGTAQIALSQLKSSIETFSSRALGYLNGSFTEEAKIYGPFCARVLLENACAALVGRLDPFRLLYLSEFQAQPTFDPNRPTKSGFKWTGDVISDDKTAATMWSSDHEISKISRALFSQHLDHVYWKPAIDRALDHLSMSQYSVPNDVLNIDSANFINITKGKCLGLYSRSSKGVHWEYFSSTLMMDEITIRSEIRETCLVVSSIGLMSHFIPTAYASLSPDDAVTAYVTFRGELS